MKPVDQRNDYDCLRACIASIFELAYEDVPQFGESAIGTEREALAQDDEFIAWLAERGLAYQDVFHPRDEANAQRLPWGYCVGAGKSPRGDFHHATVWDARQWPARLVHDPHPSRAGLKGGPGVYSCFVVLDPARFRERMCRRDHVSRR